MYEIYVHVCTYVHYICTLHTYEYVSRVRKIFEYAYLCFGSIIWICTVRKYGGLTDTHTKSP